MIFLFAVLRLLAIRAAICCIRVYSRAIFSFLKIVQHELMISITIYIYINNSDTNLPIITLTVHNVRLTYKCVRNAVFFVFLSRSQNRVFRYRYIYIYIDECATKSIFRAYCFQLFGLSDLSLSLFPR